MSSDFPARHIGPSSSDAAEMVADIGFDSVDALIDKVVPQPIRSSDDLDLPAALSESEALAELEAIMAKNEVRQSFIGQGYYDTIVPAVIQRNVLENPGWYTAYTPYQAEIAQGRLEALLNFQTMVCDLTAMPVANASLLDEGTAAAEAMAMCAASRSKGTTFFVSDRCHPQTIEILKTRAEPVGIELEIGDEFSFDFAAKGDEFIGVLLQYPATDGAVEDYADIVERAHEAAGQAVVATDLLACCLLKPPGEWGADIVVGSAQRFGVPLGFGGPHAAFMSCTDKHKRRLPGRLVGVSKDANGRPALRLSLQTREQHIRREKATSNICTA
ncbi:MAG: glycine dehydrogenase (aminomethyl-transferring), partial [Verrucomicrobiales bacterium]|nr:glycine dehydrogenase (aminomethyl-transferring) [Verrucomicrobiales bacterium]